jgi:DNA-binding transcriptional LysR family regulator
MSNLREELDKMWRVMNRLNRPNHHFKSLSAVAMLEGLGKDKITRLIPQAEDLVCGGIIRVRNGRIELTEHGCVFRDWLEELRSIQQSQAERGEELRVAVRPGVDPGILATAIATFTRFFDRISLRVVIQPEGMQEAVDSKHFTFGVTWTDAKTVGSCERIEPAAIPGSVLIPRNHRLFGADGPLDADHFTPTDVVFMAPGMEACFSGLLHRVQPANRVEVGCPETLRRLVADGHGLAVGFAHPFRSPDESTTCVQVVGVEPIWLGLVFPRKREVSDEPATMFLIEAIRKAVRDGALPDIPPLVDVPEDTDCLPELPPLPEPLPELNS